MTFWKVATAAPRKLSPDQITALIKISNALGEESNRLQATQHLMLSSPCFLKIFMWPPFRNGLAGAHNCCPILVSWRTVWVCGHIWPSILRCHDDTAKTSCTIAPHLLLSISARHFWFLQGRNRWWIWPPKKASKRLMMSTFRGRSFLGESGLVWGVPKMGAPKMDALYWKIRLRWMILGWPHFRKPLCDC